MTTRGYLHLSAPHPPRSLASRRAQPCTTRETPRPAEFLFAAVKRSGLKIGLPVPLPSMQLGTFGSITPLRKFPASRTSLFDFAASGPLSALTLSLFYIIYGLITTLETSAANISTLPIVPAALFKSSFLVGTIVSVVAPKLMTLPLSQPVPIHPSFLIGLSGIFVSALKNDE